MSTRYLKQLIEKVYRGKKVPDHFSLLLLIFTVSYHKLEQGYFTGKGLCLFSPQDSTS